MSKETLALNLRLLCRYKKSISDACRELSINRQQFNKYLSGKTSPSGNNLQKICDYFGLEEHEIWMEHDDFTRLLRARPVNESPTIASRPEIECFDQLTSRAPEDLSKYEGSYYIYYYSTSYPDQILKAYGVLYADNGKHYFKWIERLSLQNSSARDGFVYKIKGMVMGMGNRIFISGYEQVLGNELIHVTLFPTYKNRVSQLAGLMMGVSGSDSREPVCQRVILSFLGKAVSHKQALASCGIYAPDTDQIEAGILERIRNDVAPGETVFRARPL